MIRDFFMLMYTRHRPYHLGISANHPITVEKIQKEYSTYMSTRVGEEHFEKIILFSADGSYNKCQSFGGHFGNQELYSYKGYTLSKFHVVGTPRGYVLDCTAGYGGAHRSSDTMIWYNEREKDVAELQKNPHAMNLVSLCKQKENVVGFVDSGYTNFAVKEHHPSIELISTKWTKAAQTPREILDHNQMVSSVRHAQETMNKNVFTSWGIVGLKLHWSLVPDTKFVLPVLAATWNDDMWDPDRFPYENKWDESDFEERKSRYDAPELIIQRYRK